MATLDKRGESFYRILPVNFEQDVITLIDVENSSQKNFANLISVADPAHFLAKKLLAIPNPTPPDYGMVRVYAHISELEVLDQNDPTIKTKDGRVYALKDLLPGTFLPLGSSSYLRKDYLLGAFNLTVYDYWMCSNYDLDRRRWVHFCPGNTPS